MLDSQMLLPVVGERLVELSVLFAGDVVRSSGPDWLGLVQLLILGVLLLDCLLLLVLTLLIFLFILPDILSLVIADLLAPLLLDQQPDGVANKLGVLLDDF